MYGLCLGVYFRLFMLSLFYLLAQGAVNTWHIADGKRLGGRTGELDELGVWMSGESCPLVGQNRGIETFLVEQNSVSTSHCFLPGYDF